MKHLNWISWTLICVLLSTGNGIIAQNNTGCKVLLSSLTGDYKGECKKGLAHGIGEAKGADGYSGAFKKGFPHGKGIYYYANGAIYEGSFINGKRHGEGKLSYYIDGNQIIEEGLWEDDNYIGKKPEPSYEITLKQNISRYTFIKTSDTRNIITIKILRNGVIIYPDNLLLAGSGGSITQDRNFAGFEQLQFPFTGSIKYSLQTPFNYNFVDYELNFVIREPGAWEITLNH